MPSSQSVSTPSSRSFPSASRVRFPHLGRAVLHDTDGQRGVSLERCAHVRRHLVDLLGGIVVRRNGIAPRRQGGAVLVHDRNRPDVRHAIVHVDGLRRPSDARLPALLLRFRRCVGGPRLGHRHGGAVEADAHTSGFLGQLLRLPFRMSARRYV